MKKLFLIIICFTTLFVVTRNSCAAQYFSKLDGTPWSVQINAGAASFQNSDDSYFLPVVGSASIRYSVTNKLALIGVAELDMLSDTLLDVTMYSVSVGPSLNMASIVDLNELGTWIWNISGTFGVFLANFKDSGATEITDNGLVFNFGTDIGYWVTKSIGVVASIKSNMLMMGSPQLISQIGRNQQVFSIGFIFAIGGSDRGHVNYNY
ncbi:MAG: hypothetical protein ACK5IQ_05925 [Bacteroidales bacterium]